MISLKGTNSVRSVGVKGACIVTDMMLPVGLLCRGSRGWVWEVLAAEEGAMPAVEAQASNAA